MLIRVFCMQNSYLRWKQFKFLRFSWKIKKNRKMNNFGNFCEFFEIFNETLEQNIRKSQEIFSFFRWKRRHIRQNEKFSNFWENQLYRKAEGYDKIGGNYTLSANSTKICLLGYFCMQNSYLRWKQLKFLRISWIMQKKKKKE